MLSSVGQDAINRGEADPDVVGDRLAQHALVSEPQDVRRFRFGGRSPALVLTLALGLRNAFALAGIAALAGPAPASSSEIRDNHQLFAFSSFSTRPANPSMRSSMR